MDKNEQKFGIHNPELTTGFCNWFKNEGFELTDTSWHNDATDSIQIGQFQINLPNSEIADFEQEQFNTFTISLVDDFEVDELPEFEKLTEVRDYLHKNS